MERADTTVDQHRSFFAALTHPVMPVEIGMIRLRYCALPRLSYLARTTHPLTAAATRFDSIVRDCFVKLMQTKQILPVEVLEQMQLPLSMGGMGLRSVASYSPAAYSLLRFSSCHIAGVGRCICLVDSCGRYFLLLFHLHSGLLC